jgi:hypothetical protein
MKEITMLTTYLLIKFHNFSAYLISVTWNAIWNFSRDLKGKITKGRVTMGVHRPRRPRGTKPRSSGPKRWLDSHATAGRPHFGA